jgi:hypothetical protein
MFPVSYLDQLPRDILKEIFNYFNLQDANRLRRTCKILHPYSYPKKEICKIFYLKALDHTVIDAVKNINYCQLERIKNEFYKAQLNNVEQDVTRIQFSLINDPEKYDYCLENIDDTLLLFQAPNKPLNVAKISLLSLEKLKILFKNSISAKMCLKDKDRSIDTAVINQIPDDKLRLLIEYGDAALSFRKKRWFSNTEKFDLSEVNKRTANQLKTYLQKKQISPFS